MSKLFVFIFLFFSCATSFAYNYESTLEIPIKLSVQEEIKSEKDIYEGQVINFKVVNSVLYNNNYIVKRGDVVPAKVKVTIKPGMNGIPGSIIFDEFKVQGISQSKLTGHVEAFGQDRSYLVFPLKWALTILPPTGSLTNFIMGGHAKLKTNKIITIYYHPEWT